MVALLQILPNLKQFRNVYKFEVVYSDYAKNFIRQSIRNSESANSGVNEIDIGNDVIEKLKSQGFNKIVLKDYQLRDLKRLCSLPHGANFSVQGSGKTAVTLALHLILRQKKKQIA